MGVGRSFLLPSPTSSLVHPSPGEGPRAGRSGARQPPGPPAAVALVTAPANWPAEGACSGQEGQGRRLSRALGVERWGTHQRRAGGVGGQPITLGHCIGVWELWTTIILGTPPKNP